MTFLKSLRNVSLTALAASLALMWAGSASAQQISYYNFNTPATASPSQYSYSCTPNSASNPLFCFNYSGAYQDPVFFPGPTALSPWAIQLTYPQGSQAASMWFSVPQTVTNGFNVWFEFKIKPSGNSYATADGLAFVIQNALSGGTDTASGCSSTGQGPTALGGGGGCIGYSGIPNSVALEFDTYNNEPWDSADYGDGSSYANHIALQSCGLNDGAPNPNSTAHTGTGNCLLSLGGPNNSLVSTLVSNPKTSGTSPSNSTAVTLADGQVHQVVMVYNGPLDTPANTLSVYLDPQFNPGTETPVDGSIPIFTGAFDITQYINLSSDSGFSPAYVGFTSATGAAFEQHELMAWTFTPHTTVSQQQPLNQPGDPTTFNFGTHSYTTTIPTDTPTDGISMGVIANTITPDQFSSLLGLGPTQYSGSACQVYDDTGGKCIIYSVYCYYTNSMAPTACPAPATPPTDCGSLTTTDCITLKSAYNNSVEPVSPGYLQGDPLFSPISSISTTSGTATVTCAGECAVTANQTVTILDVNDNPVASNVTVQSSPAPTINTFTFTTGSAINQTGGFITSNNVQDIFVQYKTGNQDGSTTAQAKNWSDFVVTAVTNTGGQMQLSDADSNAPTQSQADLITAAITIPGPTVPENGIPANLLTLLPTGSPGLVPVGTVSFFENNNTIAINNCDSVPLTLNNSVYQATCSYTPSSTGPVTINAVYSGDAYHQIGAQALALTVNPQTVMVNVGTLPSGLSFSVNGTPYTTTQSLTWNTGANNTLATTSPQSGTPGTQYVFSSWSDGGAISHPVMTPTSTVNYTASFTTQYLLTATAGAGGSVTAANGYYTAGTLQSLLATPAAGYNFSGWTGGTAGAIANPASASTSVTMNGPETVMANFTPASTAMISPSSIDFGTLYLGSIVTKTVTIQNIGTTALSITGPRIAILRGGNSNEFVTVNLCPRSLAAGKTCVMTVTFIAGPYYTPQTAQLTITDSSPGSPQAVPLTATVINPRVGLSASSLSFGTHKVNTSTTTSLKITNTGATNLSILGVTMKGADPLDFSAPNTCPPTLTPGGFCSLSVTFTPKAKGSRTASLSITDNAQNSPQSVSLSGSGN